MLGWFFSKLINIKKLVLLWNLQQNCWLLVARKKIFFQRRVMVLTLGKLYEEGKFYRELALRFWDAIALEFYRLIREHR